MSHYNTRFQARKAAKTAKEQVPVQPINEQVSAKVVKRHVSNLEDIAGLKVLLDRGEILIGIARIKNAIEIFAYLSAHTALLNSPMFCISISNKIAEFRQEMEKKKTAAIDTVVSFHMSLENSCIEKAKLEDAHSVLCYAPILEAEFKKVESIIREMYC